MNFKSIVHQKTPFLNFRPHFYVYSRVSQLGNSAIVGGYGIVLNQLIFGFLDLS